MGRDSRVNPCSEASDGSGSARSRPPGNRGSGEDISTRRDRWLAPLLLAITLVSTLVAGALLGGADPFGLESRRAWGIPLWWPTRFDWRALARGAPFALSFLGILLAHEWAHKLAARTHGVRTSLPYFIPFPPHLSVIGTLGAFIRFRSAIPSRRALIDVGLSGPLASWAISVPMLAVGLLLSVPAEVGAREALPFLIVFHEIPIRLGEPLLVRGLVAALPIDTGGRALHLHPVAFAGWLGLMLTFLNLLPMARLDGGHILHALDPARQRWWAWATVGIFGVLGFTWAGWWAWAAVMVVLGRSRPLPADSVPPAPGLDPWRRGLGWGTLAGILLLLPPVPVAL